MEISKIELERHQKQCAKLRRYCYYTDEQNETIKQLFDNGIDDPKYIYSHAKEFGLENRSLMAIRNKIEKLRAMKKAEKSKEENNVKEN